jgi:hypothetical protein
VSDGRQAGRAGVGVARPGPCPLPSSSGNVFASSNGSPIGIIAPS